MLSITNTTQLNPRVPYQRIGDHILGSDYNLSLVLMGDALATRLNREHKDKAGPTNVLSFPLSATEGEVFINLRRAKRDAEQFDHTFAEHVAFLFIHACLHLAGTPHGAAMERAEEQLLDELYRA